VFDPYQREDEPEQPVVRDLNLYFCSHLVELMLYSVQDVSEILTIMHSRISGASPPNAAALSATV
jgi:hypothetical protein